MTTRIIEDFEILNQWEETGYGSSITLETITINAGDGAIKFDKAASGIYGGIKKSDMYTDFSRHSRDRIYVNAASGTVANIEKVEVILSEGARNDDYGTLTRQVMSELPSASGQLFAYAGDVVEADYTDGVNTADDDYLLISDELVGAATGTCYYTRDISAEVSAGSPVWGYFIAVRASGANSEDMCIQIADNDNGVKTEVYIQYDSITDINDNTFSVSGTKYIKIKLAKNYYKIYVNSVLAIEDKPVSFSGTSAISFGKIESNDTWIDQTWYGAMYGIGAAPPFDEWYNASDGYLPGDVKAWQPEWIDAGDDTQGAIVGNDLVITSSGAAPYYAHRKVDNNILETNPIIIIDMYSCVSSGATSTSQFPASHANYFNMQLGNRVNIIFGATHLELYEGSTSVATISIDGTIKHDYKLVIDSVTKKYILLIDGICNATGTMSSALPTNAYVYFGKMSWSTSGDTFYIERFGLSYASDLNYSVYQFGDIVEGWNTLEFNPNFPEYEVGSPTRQAVTDLEVRLLTADGDAVTDTIVDTLAVVEEEQVGREPIVIMEWDVNKKPIEDFDSLTNFEPYGDADIALDITNNTEGTGGLTFTKAGLDTDISGASKEGNYNFTDVERIELDCVLSASAVNKTESAKLILDETEVHKRYNVWYKSMLGTAPDGADGWGTLGGVDHSSTDNDVLTIENASTDQSYYYVDMHDAGRYVAQCFAHTAVATGITSSCIGMKLGTHLSSLEVYLNSATTVIKSNDVEIVTLTIDNTSYGKYKCEIDTDGSYSVILNGSTIYSGITVAATGGYQKVAFGKFGTDEENGASYWDTFRATFAFKNITYNAATGDLPSDNTDWYCADTTHSEVVSNVLEITDHATEWNIYATNCGSLVDAIITGQPGIVTIETEVKLDSGAAADTIVGPWFWLRLTYTYLYLILSDGNPATRINVDLTEYRKIKITVNTYTGNLIIYVDDVKVAEANTVTSGYGNTRSMSIYKYAAFGKYATGLSSKKSYWKFFKVAYDELDVDSHDYQYHPYDYTTITNRGPEEYNDPQFTLADVDHGELATVWKVHTCGTDTCNYTLDTAVADSGGWTTDQIIKFTCFVRVDDGIGGDTCQLRIQYDTNALTLKIKETGIYSSSDVLIYSKDMTGQIVCLDLTIDEYETKLYVNNNYAATIVSTTTTPADYFISFGKFVADDDDVAQHWGPMGWTAIDKVQSIYTDANLRLGRNRLSFVKDVPTEEIGSPSRQRVNGISVIATTYNGATLAAGDIVFDRLMSSSNTTAYAKIDYIANDASRRWRGKILGFGDLTRGSNEQLGNYSVSDMQIDIENVDGEFSELWQKYTNGLANTDVTIKFGYPEYRYSEFIPLFTGNVVDFNFENYTFKLNATDTITKHFTRLPNQYITAEDFSNAPDSSLGQVGAVIAGTVTDTYGALPTIPVDCILVIDSSNDYLNFRELKSGSELTAKLAHRSYNNDEMDDLATALSTAMNTVSTRSRTYTWTFTDDREFKVTHSEGSGASTVNILELLSNSGTNAANAIWKTIGFNTEYDHDGSTEYTGETVAWNVFVCARHACKNDTNAAAYIDKEEITDAVFNFNYGTGTSTDGTVIEDYDDISALVLSPGGSMGELEQDIEIVTEGTGAAGVIRPGGVNVSGPAVTSLLSSPMDLSDDKQLALDITIATDTIMDVLCDDNNLGAVKIGVWSASGGAARTALVPTDTDTGWSADTDCANIAVDTTTYMCGGGAIQWDKTGGTTTATGIKYIMSATDFTNKKMVFYLYIPDAATVAKIACINFILLSTGGYSGWYKYDKHVGWNAIYVDVDATPNETWGTLAKDGVTIIYIRPHTVNATDTYNNIAFGGLYDVDGSFIPLDEFADSAIWSDEAGDGTIGENTTYRHAGYSSVSRQKTNVDGVDSGIISGNWLYRIADYTEFDSMSFDVYIPAAEIADITSVQIYFMKNDGDYNIYEYWIFTKNTGELKSGWNTLTFDPQSADGTVGAADGTVRRILLRYNVNANATTVTDPVLFNNFRGTIDSLRINNDGYEYIIKSSELSEGLNTVEINLDQFNNTIGTPDLSAVNAVSVEFLTNNPSDTFASIPIDNLRIIEHEHYWTTVYLPRNITNDCKVNLSGLTEENTSTGTLITDPIDFFKYAMIHLVGYPQYQINTDAFAAAKVLSQSRNYTIAGAIVDDIERDSFIEEYCLNWAMDFWVDRYGRISVGLFTQSISDAEVPDYTDELHFLAESFGMDPGITNTINKIKYQYNQNFYDMDYKKFGELQDDVSIANAGKTYEWPTGVLEFRWIRSATVANRVAEYILRRYAGGCPVVKTSLPMLAWHHDIDDKVKITHGAGPNYKTYGSGKTHGYEGVLHRIREMSYNLNEFTTDVTFDGFTRLGFDCFFLGSKLWDAADLLYPSATEAKQRNYGYLCDRTTGEFSDGDPGKRLC